MAAKRVDKRASGSKLPVPRTGDQPAPAGGGGLSRLGGVSVVVSLELGRTEITLEEAQKLGKKSLLAVDKRANEPVQVYVNGKLFGHGKLVMVGDNYGVQLIEVVDQADGQEGNKKVRGVETPRTFCFTCSLLF